MSREVDAEAEFRFHPVTRPGVTTGAALVVLDGVEHPTVGVPTLRLAAR